MKAAKDLLTEALSERVATNAKYSLRAFARDLGISAQALSNVMNGHRGLSPGLAAKLLPKLGLTSYEETLFLESLKAKFARSKTQRAVAVSKLQSLAKKSDTKNLEIDLFKAISNWQHFALIELIKISSSRKNKVTWFSKKLGISENETLTILDRLKRLELITKTKTGWIANQDAVIADLGVPTEAVRNYHRHMLEKSAQALAFQNKDE